MKALALLLCLGLALAVTLEEQEQAVFMEAPADDLEIQSAPTPPAAVAVSAAPVATAAPTAAPTAASTVAPTVAPSPAVVSLPTAAPTPTFPPVTPPPIDPALALLIKTLQAGGDSSKVNVSAPLTPVASAPAPAAPSAPAVPEYVAAAPAAPAPPAPEYVAAAANAAPATPKLIKPIIDYGDQPPIRHHYHYNHQKPVVVVHLDDSHAADSLPVAYVHQLTHEGGSSAPKDYEIPEFSVEPPMLRPERVSHGWTRSFLLPSEAKPVFTASPPPPFSSEDVDSPTSPLVSGSPLLDTLISDLPFDRVPAADHVVAEAIDVGHAPLSAHLPPGHVIYKRPPPPPAPSASMAQFSIPLVRADVPVPLSIASGAPMDSDAYSAMAVLGLVDHPLDSRENSAAETPLEAAVLSGEASLD